ncbi:MAG: hypothetical protein RR539_00265 [Clostridium sp.]|uniref:hypothetical protein n=1 Tax=Clostridium sp. TaxID=1506 RepID=UPI002FC6ADAC
MSKKSSCCKMEPCGCPTPRMCCGSMAVPTQAYQMVSVPQLVYDNVPACGGGYPMQQGGFGGFGGCGSGGGCSWLIIIILLLCCCGGGGYGGCNDGCGDGCGFGGCSWIVIIILLLCCCGGC